MAITIGSMTAAELRKLCLGFPGAVEEFPFGTVTSVFKVEGKIFALSPLRSRPLNVSLKCEPELAEQLRAAHSAVVPGYHLNKRHWNTVTLASRTILGGAHARPLWAQRPRGGEPPLDGPAGPRAR